MQPLQTVFTRFINLITSSELFLVKFAAHSHISTWFEGSFREEPFLLIKNNFRLKLKFLSRIKSIRHACFRFLIYDRNLIGKATFTRASKGFSVFKGVFFSTLRDRFFAMRRVEKNPLKLQTVRRKFNFGAFYTESSSFYGLVFKLNFFALCVLDNKFEGVGVSDNFLERALLSIVLQLLKLTRSYKSFSKVLQKAAVGFLVSRVRFLYLTTTVSPKNFVRLIIYTILAYSKFFRRFKRPVLPNNRNFCVLTVAEKKFKKLPLRLLFNSFNQITGVESGQRINARNFFANYIKVKTWWSKRYKKYIVLRAKKKYFFRFRGKSKKVRPVVETLRVRYFYRMWRRLKSYFKLLFSNKQFFFTSFWSFNFFNLFRPVGGLTTRKTFYRTLRLIYFFKRFFDFFKFYGFYFRLARATMLSNVSLVTKDRRLPFFSSNLLSFM